MLYSKAIQRIMKIIPIYLPLLKRGWEDFRRKKRFVIPIFIGIPFASYILFLAFLSPSTNQGKTAKVTKEPLTVWSIYEGKLEARKVITIMSKFRSNATVVELAPEGERVSKGDILVRFDSSALERDVLKLERDYALAGSELNSLKNAKLPLELRDLEIKLLEIQATLNSEQQYLDAIIEFAKEDLVSQQEIEQQKLKIAKIKTQLNTLELQMKLTKEFLHPSELKRALVKLASAEQEMKLAREQLQNSIVLAPSDGIVVYNPLPIGTEFRMVRVGDTIYPNQPFMMLPDMNDLIVHCNIPENELSRVQKGKTAFIKPLAYPDLRLQGIVETVGSMAQNMPEQPQWQKFFRVVIGLKDFDSRLKPGMSVTAYILSYNNPEAILIPRTAVRWEEGKPYAKVITRLSQKKRELKLGMANDMSYEVIEGVKPGDAVFVE
ncbi:MAG: efflux RND transporter periplasmic adaptor subunit [Nitrospirota bacterium]